MLSKPQQYEIALIAVALLGHGNKLPVHDDPKYA